jgi:hypothetical protein
MTGSDGIPAGSASRERPKRLRAPAPWPGPVVRLGADVRFSIEEQHPHQLAGINHNTSHGGLSRLGTPKCQTQLKDQPEPADPGRL